MEPDSMAAHLVRKIESLTRANTPLQEEGLSTPDSPNRFLMPKTLAPCVPQRRATFDCTVPSIETHDEPTLLQKIKHEGSVLSLAVSDYYIFAGTQRNKILVWQMRAELTGRFGTSIRMKREER